MIVTQNKPPLVDWLLSSELLVIQIFLCSRLQVHKVILFVLEVEGFLQFLDLALDIFTLRSVSWCPLLLVFSLLPFMTIFFSAIWFIVFRLLVVHPLVDLSLNFKFSFQQHLLIRLVLPWFSDVTSSWRLGRHYSSLWMLSLRHLRALNVKLLSHSRWILKINRFGRLRNKLILT